MLAHCHTVVADWDTWTEQSYINVISNTCAVLALTSQNVCFAVQAVVAQQRVLKILLPIILFIFWSSLSFCRIISSNRSHIVKLPLSRVWNQNDIPSSVLCQISFLTLYDVIWWFILILYLSLLLSLVPSDLTVIATEIHAHLPPVPAAQQPPGQGGSFSHCQEAIRQHLRLPVSPLCSSH